MFGKESISQPFFIPRDRIESGLLLDLFQILSSKGSRL